MPPKKPSYDWPPTKAKQALAALLPIGWTIKRHGGTSHRILARPGWQDVLFAYHDRVTLGPTAMKVLAGKTGLNDTRSVGVGSGNAPDHRYSIYSIEEWRRKAGLEESMGEVANPPRMA